MVCTAARLKFPSFGNKTLFLCKKFLLYLTTNMVACRATHQLPSYEDIGQVTSLEIESVNCEIFSVPFSGKYFNINALQEIPGVSLPKLVS